MLPAKLTLSPDEQQLVTNAGFILTKNAIIRKVFELFGNLSDYYRTAAAKYPALLADEAFILTPKIAKGESYEGLPWVMLDYPRCFTKEGVFAVRSFFWWGHFCSITLQLSGKFSERYAGRVQQYLLDEKSRASGEEADSEWFVGMGTDPWQHHFREDNYQPLQQFNISSLMKTPFLKMAKKIPLEHWDETSDFFELNYTILLQVLAQDQAPSL